MRSSPLPSSWRLVRIGDVTRNTRYGINEPTSSTGLGPRLLRISDVNDYGEISTTAPIRLQRRSKDFEKYSLKHGDLLLARSGSVGRSFVVTGEIADWVFASYFIRFRMVLSLVDPAYLNFFCRSVFFREQVARIARVVAQPNVNSGEFAAMFLPLPPLSEQRRIVELLQEAESIRQLQTGAETTVSILIGEIFNEMFVQNTERQKWTTTTVEDSAASARDSIRTGPFGSDLLHSEFIEEGIPVLGIDNVVTNRFRWKERRFIPENTYKELKRFTVFPEDVLVTIMGTVGRSCVAPADLPKCISTKHLCVITLNKEKLFPSYLSAAFVHDPQVRRQTLIAGRGAIMEGWNSKIIKALRITRPPLSLQKEFATKADATEKIHRGIDESRKNANLLNESLSALAFSGKLTSEWRDPNSDLLALEASERDLAIKQLEARAFFKTVPVERKASTRRLDGAAAELNREQLKLLSTIRERFGGVRYAQYFSAALVSNSFEDSFRRNPQAVEGHLAVLAARGLVIPISREEQAEDTGEYIFGNAYRLPLSDYEPAEGEEPVIGDHARLRELERLASQLEKEQML